MADKADHHKADKANTVTSEHQHAEENNASTLESLLRRMRSQSDFPALSSTISEINRVVDDDSASTNLLAQSILQDFALTNKLLKLVNTVTYGQFGGKINTISKAVVILGFETVRNVAMTLILLDFLQNKTQVAQLKDDVLASFFAGIVAAQFSAVQNIKDAEEVMICSMFRNLGKLLASFYFFEDSQRIAAQVEQGANEDQAAIELLGISYNELGIGVAKSWSFPARLIVGMRKLSGEKIAKPQGELDKLSVSVNLAHELCTIARYGDVKDKPKALTQLAKRYENALGISEQQLRKAIEHGLGELASRARIISMDLAQSLLFKRVKLWVGALTEPTIQNQDATDGLAGITQLGAASEQQEQTDDNSEAARQTPEAILTAGIQEITNTLVEEHKLNDVLQMVLETMHRGMKFNRTLFLVSDVKTGQMLARFGFGHDVDMVLPRFRFPINSAADVFHLATNKGADLLIEDVQADNIADKIPKWYRTTVNAQSFLLLPVMVNNKAVGLFYGDSQQANAMQIPPRLLAQLRTLRNQAVLAIKQKN